MRLALNTAVFSVILSVQSIAHTDIHKKKQLKIFDPHFLFLLYIWSLLEVALVISAPAIRCPCIFLYDHLLAHLRLPLMSAVEGQNKDEKR